MAQIEFLSADNPTAFTEVWYEIANDDHFWIRWRFAVLLGEIRRLGLDISKGLAGLDIGCGHGTMLRKLSTCTAWHLDGCDLNKAALLLSSGHAGRVLFYNVNDRRSELAEHYDFLLLLDVIEHVEDTKYFIESASYHLKPSGYVFVNVPALQILYSKYDAVQGHCRRYNRSLLRAHLTAGGLEICSMRYWGATMVPIAMIRKLLVNTMHDPSEIIRRGFEAPGRLTMLLFPVLGFIEQKLLTRQPMGTSLFAVARKAG